MDSELSTNVEPNNDKKNFEATDQVVDNQLFVNAIESCHSAVIICKANYPDNNIVFANRTFEILTGYSNAEILNQPYLFLLSNDRDQPELGSIQTALERKQDVEAVLRCYRKDGSSFWGEFFVSVIKNSEGVITHFMLFIVNITGRTLETDKLNYYTTHDALTDLPNRALLLDRIEQTLAFSKRYGMNFAILFIDLDHFKEFNATHGTAAGNALLQAVASRLNSSIRENDSVARITSDRFVIILSSLVKEDDYQIVVQRIQKNLSEPIYFHAKKLTITASMGISLYPRNGQDTYALLKNSDIALQQAKAQGPNTVQTYGAEIKSLSHNELETIKNDIRRAITQNELSLQYQPIIDLATGNIISINALARWRHPVLGLIPPATFIPIAEHSNQIIPVGEWILTTACKQNRAWQDSGLPAISIAVNLSKFQIINEQSINSIIHILKETKLSPKYLELELPASIILEKSKEMVSLLLELQALGITAVIDNFGISHKDLNEFLEFPMQKIKLDRELIRTVITNHESADIVLSIAKVAKQYKIRIIAEGVETKEQLAFLRQNNIDEIQGYIFSRPLSAPACTRLLLEKRTLDV